MAHKKQRLLRGTSALAGLVLAGAVGAHFIFNRADSEPAIEKYISATADGRELHVPDYRLDGVKCSQYARLTAQSIFGITYPMADAWNRPQVDEVVASVRNFDELRNTAIKPGMIVGLYNPSSQYNAEGRPFTHTGLYLGKNSNDRPVFAHYYHNDSLVETDHQLAKRGLEPRVVLKAKSNK